MNVTIDDIMAEFFSTEEELQGIGYIEVEWVPEECDDEGTYPAGWGVWVHYPTDHDTSLARVLGSHDDLEEAIKAGQEIARRLGVPFRLGPSFEEEAAA